MRAILRSRSVWGIVGLLTTLVLAGRAEEPSPLPRAFLDGTGPGWKTLGEQDFVNVNCDPDTWTWKDGVVHCTGQPVGVIRRRRSRYTNFELVAQLAAPASSAGNSGIFVWAPEEALEGLKPGTLPSGGHRGAGARPRLRRAVREADRQEGRLVHDPRRRLPRRHVEDDARSRPRRPTARGASPRST